MRTAKASATPHRPDCPCRPCIGHRRRAGLPQPVPRVPADATLAKRALALQRAVYGAQRAVDRANRLLVQVMPAQRAPGAPGDPMQGVRDWIAAGKP